MRKCESEKVPAVQLCPTLCDAIERTPPGSSVHGILQARILEWIAPLEDLPDPGIKPVSPALADGLFFAEPLGKLYIHTLLYIK